jgi:membrane-bound lytic murein transglycosylase A
MADGSVMHVGYAGQNGHEYVSLGKIMGDEGVLPKDKINFFTIRQWLYDNPSHAIEMMTRNPSYVFFKPIDREGAVGAVGVVLTPRRSLAIDSKYIPYGLPLFLETTLPGVHGGSATSFNRLMVAQDTGGAIRGPVRGDIFFGVGEEAEYLAGYMKNRGTYNLLVPKEAADQLR